MTTESDVLTLLRDYVEKSEENAVDWMTTGKAEDFAEYKRQCGRVEAYRDVLNELREIEEKLLAQ